ADPKDPETTKTNNTNPEAVVKTDQKEADPKKKSSGMKIKWGFDVSGGITSAETEVFTALKTTGTNNAAGLNSSSPVAAASPFPGAATTLPPSSVESGAGFKVGVVGELGISKRSRVSLGLQYMYASNHIKTGTADRALRSQATSSFSSVDQVYRGPQTNSYENSYHFVSLPVSYHWRFNKSEKTGLRWNVSVSPSYLVSTDALIYSSSNGGSYYHDKSAFNKFHFSIGTGLSLHLKAKKGMEYIFGPEISFDTRKLMSNADQQQQYLIYGGIGARILFPSKKK
ncbi:MAG: outer membrane beta-barrel protein, partial [Chitinophagales bacterium]